MRFLRPILAAILAVALAQYGVAASAAPHAHADDEFHAVHVIALDMHDGGHQADGPEHHDHDRDAVQSSGGDHDETDLHAHCAPHFTEAGETILLTAAIVSDATRYSLQSTLLASRRAAPPFKPPRTSL